MAVVLTPLDIDDERSLAESLRGDSGPYDLGVPRPALPSGTTHWLSGALERAAAGTAIVAAIRPTRDSIAGTGSLSSIDYRFGVAQLSYWISPPYRCRGYATATARLLTSFAFQHLGLARIITSVSCQNTASRTVLESAGFRLKPLRVSGTGLMFYGELRSTPPALTHPGAERMAAKLKSEAIMLLIRPEQIRVFREEGLRALAAELAREIEMRSPEGARALTRDALEYVVFRAVVRAWNYGFREDRHLLALAQLAVLAGPEFDAYPPIEELLTRSELSPAQRLDYLFRIVREEDWRSAGTVYSPSALQR